MSHEGNAPTGQEATPDRKALLLEQFNEVEAGNTAPPPEKTPAQPDRARDEAGKFVATGAKPRLNALGGNDAITAADILAEPPAPVATPEPNPWDQAPPSWKKDKHALWQAMTPEQREYAFQREEQMRAGVEPLLPKAQLADQITKAAEPYMNTIRGLGLELPQAVSGLMKIDHDLRTLPYEQKVQLLVQTARGYGVDLTGQAQQAQQAFDPNFQMLQNELLAIKGQQAAFIQQQEAAQDAAALTEIQKFAKTVEHFEDVKPLMVQLLQSNVADGLQDAYDKAVRLTPEIFDQIQTAKQAATEAEKRAIADAAAKKAKAAAVSPKSATPGTQKPTNAQDRRSMLREQLDSLSDRL